MAKAPKKKVVEAGTWFEPYMANYPPTVNPSWVAPELPEKEPMLPGVEEVPKTHQVILVGKHLHTIGINGTNHQYLGGVEHVVEENIYHILKDADLIREEL